MPFSPLVDWVENGNAPATILGTAPATEPRSPAVRARSARILPSRSTRAPAASSSPRASSVTSTGIGRGTTMKTTTTAMATALADCAARSAKNAALALAKERPEMGKVRAARELRGRGIHLSPSAVHTIWKQHGLATSYDRLRRGRAALSESQRACRAVPPSAAASPRVPARNGSGNHPRREELIAAAAKIFSARGYQGASLREICAAAGILAGSMYHHFRSKEDLFVSVHAQGFLHLNEVVDRALEGKTEPWGRLEAACAAHLTLLVGSPDASLVTGTSLFHTAPPALQRRLNRDRDAYEARYTALIDGLGLAADVDRSVVRLNLLGALNWTRMWYRPGKRNPKELAHHLVQVMLHRSLGAPGRDKRAQQAR